MNRRSLLKGFFVGIALAALAPVQKIIPTWIWSRWNVIRYGESVIASRITLNKVDGQYRYEIQMQVPNKEKV